MMTYKEFSEKYNIHIDFVVAVKRYLRKKYPEKKILYYTVQDENIDFILDCIKNYKTLFKEDISLIHSYFYSRENNRANLKEKHNKSHDELTYLQKKKIEKVLKKREREILKKERNLLF